MNIGFSREVKAYTKNALDRASYNPRKLALIYIGVATGIAYLLTLIIYFLSHQIDATGGISGMGLRSVLSTIQSVLPLLSGFFVLFWDVGFLRAGMGYARNEEVTPGILTAGFRRFGPVLRLFLLRFVVFILLTIVSANIGSIIFSMTPWSAKLQPIAEKFVAAGEFTDEIIAEMTPLLMPMYGIFFVVLAILAIPIFYRLRMAEFILMDKPVGALPACLISFRLTQGNWRRLLRLDLSFWWFYALSICSAVIGYLDTILPALGITLPFSADVSFFLFYTLHALCQILLTYLVGSYVQTSYATAFDAFIPKAPETPDNTTVNM